MPKIINLAEARKKRAPKSAAIPKNPSDPALDSLKPALASRRGRIQPRTAGDLLAKLKRLERDLAGNARLLRRAVESHVVAIAGAKPDIISGFGLTFRSMDGKVVTLASGEADQKQARPKIDKIVKGCIEAAKDDAAFLKRALKSAKAGAPLSENDAARLNEIFEGNGYWRLIQET